jgi:hypothetical protein
MPGNRSVEMKSVNSFSARVDNSQTLLQPEFDMSTFLSILVLCITIWYTTCQTGAGEDEVIIKKRYIWTDPLAIGSRFAFDLANEECTSVASGFASIDDCLNGTTIAIQYAKLVLAYQTSYKAVDIITNNTMIPMAAEWQKGVEGNSFAYSAKVRMLQEIADDPRIVRICEVGFNMGHSVSSTILRSHSMKPVIHFFMLLFLPPEYELACFQSNRGSFIF